MRIHNISGLCVHGHHMPAADVFSGSGMDGRFSTADYLRR